MYLFKSLKAAELYLTKVDMWIKFATIFLQIDIIVTISLCLFWRKLPFKANVLDG